MNLYIVIATYNAMPWISKCLARTKSYPVIIIDNNSTDGTVDFIKKNYPKVILLNQNENLGFGQANNIGISYALKERTDYVFLLNQDAYLEEGCIEKLIEFQKSHPSYGILSPVHLNGSKSRLDKNFSLQMNFNSNPDFYSDFILNKKIQKVYDIPFINAAGWLISRECLETVGGFDPLFFLYGEDDNYCQRVRYHNLEIGVIPTAFICHDRENREGKYTYNDQERLLKIKYSNINISFKSILKEELGEINRLLARSLFRFNIKRAFNLNNERRKLKKWKKLIMKSRFINKSKGTHYLQ